MLKIQFQADTIGARTTVASKRVFPNWHTPIANMELGKTLGKQWSGFILSNKML